MKKILLLALVCATVAFGCGSPLEKSMEKLKQSALAYDEATQALEKANKAPEKSRGMFMAEVEKYKEQAIKLGKEAIALDPTNLSAYFNTAVMMQAIAKPTKTQFADLDLFMEAIELYEKGLAAMPPPPYTTDSLKNFYTKFNNSLSICYRDLSDLYATEKFADKDINKSLDYAKKSAEHAERVKDYLAVNAATASFKYAGLLHKYKRWNEAVPAFEKALELHKFAYERTDNPDVVANLRDIGLFYAESVQKQAEANGVKMKSLGKDDKGNEIKVPDLDAATIDKVLNVYQESLKIDPHNWDLYAAMFQFAYDYGKEKIVLDLLKNAVEQKKDDARGYEVLGTLLENMGKKAEAAPYIKKYKELSGKK
ncbi:MAG: tetratricopeptide repeat protein [Chloroherpetonaceae bacterium]|nr:tetratricopeptide repeat protein [Chloroherpetonaceae bacterium]MDW8438337.1 tetratricopeptide repeat protein [Chloroherpetonaceae bacterium]